MKWTALGIIVILLLVGVVSADTTILKPTEEAAAYGGGLGGSYTQMRNIDESFGEDSTGWTQVWAYSTSNTWYTIERTFLGFNMSTIETDKGVTSAKLCLYGTNAVQEFSTNKPITITKGTPANYASYAVTDFNNWDDVEFSNISWGSWSTPAYNNFTINSDGITYLNTRRGTNFTLVVRDGFDVQNVSPTWVSGGQNSVLFDLTADAHDPEIDIVWSASDTTPPASITNLNNNTQCNYINWTWTKPVDTDFNYLYVLKNNTFFANVSNSTQFSNWTELYSNLSYTFSSKTVDLAGNMNATWVNQTNTTKQLAFNVTRSGSGLKVLWYCN